MRQEFDLPENGWQIFRDRKYEEKVTKSRSKSIQSLQLRLANLILILFFSPLYNRGNETDYRVTCNCHNITVLLLRNMFLVKIKLTSQNTTRNFNVIYANSLFHLTCRHGDLLYLKTDSSAMMTESTPSTSSPSTSRASTSAAAHSRPGKQQC